MVNLIKSAKIRFYNNVTIDYPAVGKTLSKLKRNKERKFHAYCVGLPRSGTHSIAKMLEDEYMSSHEPYHASMIKFLMSEKNKSAKSREEYIRVRDSLLNLEMESTHLLHNFMPELVKLFPESKFLLTVREPRSWLESEFNQLLKPGKGKQISIWSNYDELKYGNFKSEPESNKIKGRGGLYPLKSILKYYKYHISAVIDNVPVDRLLIIDTFEIKLRIKEVSNFLNIDESKINLNKTHSAKNKNKIPLEQFLPDKEIEDLIARNLGAFINDKVPILSKYFKN